MASAARVAVVGGGVSGLATAHFLRHNRPEQAPALTLLEAGPRVGGKVLTRSLDGLPVDTGPDAVLMRLPAMQALLDRLGLSDEVVASAPLGVYLWWRGSLHRLPPGTLFGVPDRIVPLLRTRMLSPRGLVRAGLDVVLPRRELPDDPSIAELLRARFGSQVVERLIDPLVGGVYASTTAQLSAASAFPEIESLVRGNRSVYLALRRRRRQAAPAGPGLVSFDGGLDRLITALSQSLGQTTVLTGAPVISLQQSPNGFRLSFGADQMIESDAVVLATPAHVTADLLDDIAPGAATALREIPYVDVATVTLAYPRSAVTRPLDATGFLVPPGEGHLLIGCQWLSTKWTHLSGGPHVLIRGMVGRSGDSRWMALDDDALAGRVHEELVAAMGLAQPPTNTLVQRWPHAIPQYAVGHRERLNRVGAALAGVPGLFLAGAAHRGVGVASCVAHAHVTADAVLDHLS